MFPLQGGASASLLVGIGVALVVEGGVLHLWLAARHLAWAWTVTALNAATLVWLWRDYQARALAMLTLGDRDVVITVGNQLRCRVPRLGIASAEMATWRSVPDPDMARDYVNTAKPLEPNVMLTFREPVDARTPIRYQEAVDAAWRPRRRPGTTDLGDLYRLSAIPTLNEIPYDTELSSAANGNRTVGAIATRSRNSVIPSPRSATPKVSE